MGTQTELLRPRPLDRVEKEAGQAHHSITIAGLRAVGIGIQMQTDRLGVLDALSVLGDVVTLKLGPKRLVFVFCPRLARIILRDRHNDLSRGMGLDDARILLGSGLLTSDGDIWARRRPLVKTALDRHSTQAMMTAMGGAVRSVTESMGFVAGGSKAVDVGPFSKRLALRALGVGLLDSDLTGDRAERLIKAYNVVSTFIRRRMTSLFKIPLGLPTLGNRRMLTELAVLTRWADKLVDLALSERLSAESYLSRLIGQGVRDRDQLRDEALTMFVAGHETVSSTIAWAMVYIAGLPAIQDQLRSEILANVEDDCCCIDRIARLPLLKAVVQETMRLKPPVWMISRRALRTIEIDNEEIAGGSDILVPVYSLHRDEKYWMSPEDFDPSRFLQCQSKNSSAKNFLPFGAGPRTCVGNKHGIYEAMVAIGHLVRGFQLHTDQQLRVNNSNSVGLTLSPDPTTQILLTAL